MQQNLTTYRISRPKWRRSFLGAADERNYVMEVLEYYKSLNAVESKVARRYLLRFSRLLKRAGLDNGSIMLQTQWSLLHELRGNIDQAIFHRKCQIRLLNRLLTKYGPSKSHLPLYSIDKSYLSRAMQALYGHYIIKREFKKADRLGRKLKLLKRGSRRQKGH